MSNRQIEIETTDRIEELRYEPVSPKYRAVQRASATITYATLAALALLLLLVDNPWWCVAAEAVIVVSLIVNLVILSKAYLRKGYALREHDITYRSGGDISDYHHCTILQNTTGEHPPEPRV